MIVTITPTPLDGTVLRWFDTGDADGATGAPLVSVSHHRLEVRAGAEVPEDVQRAAIEAFIVLRADRLADVRRFATHYRTIRSGLVPIEKAGV
jgi:hypothetical protein